MGSFDPFAATFEEATEAQRKAAALDDSPSWWQMPVSQWLFAKELADHRERYEVSDVLDGIGECVRRSMQPPKWLVDAFVKRWTTGRELNSWDRAFGNP